MTPFAFYGTLMSGGRLAPGLADFGRHGGPCVIPGRLYDLGAYPALTREEGRVAGQLWTPFDGAEGAALRRVDMIEGEGTLYRRARVRLLEPEGVEAWVYSWAGDPAWLQAPRVASGDWRRLAGAGR